MVGGVIGRNPLGDELLCGLMPLAVQRAVVEVDPRDHAASPAARRRPVWIDDESRPLKADRVDPELLVELGAVGVGLAAYKVVVDAVAPARLKTGRTQQAAVRNAQQDPPAHARVQVRGFGGVRETERMRGGRRSERTIRR